MKILFLDIDGVLNEHETLDPEVECGRFHADKVARLNRVLRDTGAKIVLSSAWRYFIHRGEMNLTGLDWLLRSHGIMQGRLIGVTERDAEREDPHWDGKSWPLTNERGGQIANYLRHKVGLVHVERYAVVDDLDLGISEALHPFVQTVGTVGLTDYNAGCLVQMLN